MNHDLEVEAGARVGFYGDRVVTQNTHLHVVVVAAVGCQCLMTAITAFIGNNVAMGKTRVRLCGWNPVVTWIAHGAA